MSLFNSTWTLKDVSVEARQAAARAASADGEDLGVWLSRLIRKASAVEMSAAPAATESAGAAPDDKLTSIERAMLRPGSNAMSGNVSSA